jgi:hypothetical protein
MCEKVEKQEMRYEKKVEKKLRRNLFIRFFEG